MNCSNHLSSQEESISSVKFAQRAKMIKSQIKIQKKSQKDLEEEVACLREELNSTKSQLEQLRRGPFSEAQRKMDTQESDIHFLAAESSKKKGSVYTCIYEVQSKLSYLLNGFSIFIKDFTLNETQSQASRKLVTQFLDLNQSFQTLATHLKAEEMRALTFTKQTEESESTQSFVHTQKNDSSIDLEQDYQYQYKVKSQLTEESQDIRPVKDLRKLDGKQSDFKENFEP